MASTHPGGAEVSDKSLAFLWPKSHAPRPVQGGFGYPFKTFFIYNSPTILSVLVDRIIYLSGHFYLQQDISFGKNQIYLQKIPVKWALFYTKMAAFICKTSFLHKNKAFFANK